VTLEDRLGHLEWHGELERPFRGVPAHAGHHVEVAFGAFVHARDGGVPALGGGEMVWSSMLVMSVSREKIWQKVSLDVLGGVAVCRGVVVLGSGALSHSVKISVAICSRIRGRRTHVFACRRAPHCHGHDADMIRYGRMAVADSDPLLGEGADRACKTAVCLVWY
jgi:hypothetical protein